MFILILISGTFAFADEGYDSVIREAAKSKQWHRILHYNRRFPFWRYHSIVDGKNFFFSEHGDEDPESELRATIDAFRKGGERGHDKLHPQCAFPARFDFVTKSLGIAIPAVRCETLDAFLTNFKPKSATLVFSSAYPNNPASIFGHTFIRINSRPPESGERKLDILDKTINFAAYVPPDAGFAEFAILGLSGGYMGRFSMLPYYAKLNEYTNGESRDLWEYDVNLTEEETVKLLKNTWEIEENADYEYYFLDENCSYMMLELLEATKPEWHITDVGVHAIPGETVKKLTDIPGAVTKVTYRPSLQKKLMAKISALNVEERRRFWDLAYGRVEPEASADPRALDVAITYYYYEKQKAEGKLSAEKQARFQRMLTKRASLGVAPEVAVDQDALLARENTRPDLGHHANRLGVSGGSNGEAFTEIQFKFAYHDLMNDDTGYTRFSHVDFPQLRLRYAPKTGKLNFEELYGVGVTSLFPMNVLEKRLSWKFDIKMYTPKDFGCTDCHAYSFEGGSGASVNLWTPRVLISALALGNFEALPSSRLGWRINPKLWTALLANPFGHYKIMFAWAGNADLFQTDRQKFFQVFEINQSLRLSREVDLRLSTQTIKPSEERSAWYREAKLTTNYYF